MMLKMRKKKKKTELLLIFLEILTRSCPRGSREGRHGRPSVFMYQGEVLQNR